MTNYCYICKPKNTVETSLPPDKYGIYLCEDCNMADHVMHLKYALAKEGVASDKHHPVKTGYHIADTRSTMIAKYEGENTDRWHKHDVK